VKSLESPEIWYVTGSQQISGHLCAHLVRGLPIGCVLPGRGIVRPQSPSNRFSRATLYQARGFG
jgi:hypothetical protein